MISGIELQPNVVAPTSHAIPVAGQSLSAHSVQHSIPTGPFPFASMTKVAHTLKSSLTSSTHTSSQSTVSPPAVPVSLSSSTSTSSLPTPTSTPPQKTPGGKASGRGRNIALTSPLLVNLLQGSDVPVVGNTGAASSQLLTESTKPAKVKRAKKQKISGEFGTVVLPEKTDPVVKKVAKPRKKKKLDVDLNGIVPSIQPESHTVSVSCYGPQSLSGKKDHNFVPKDSSDLNLFPSLHSTPTTSTYITVLTLNAPTVSRNASSPTVPSSTVSWNVPVIPSASSGSSLLSPTVIPVCPITQ